MPAESDSLNHLKMPAAAFDDDADSQWRLRSGWAPRPIGMLLDTRSRAEGVPVDRGPERLRGARAESDAVAAQC